MGGISVKPMITDKTDILMSHILADYGIRFEYQSIKILVDQRFTYQEDISISEIG